MTKNLSLYELILKKAFEDGGVHPFPDTFNSDACRKLDELGLLESLGDGRFAATEIGQRGWEDCHRQREQGYEGPTNPALTSLLAEREKGQ